MSEMTEMAEITKLETLPAVTDQFDLLAVLQELNAAPDLKTGLERVAELIRGVIRYDNLSVLLLDELGRELRYAVAVGAPADVAEHWRFGMGQGIVGTVAQTRRPLRVGDVQKDARFILAGVPIRSELALPLLSQNRTVGVLDVGSFEADFFTAEHERLLGSLAGFLAAAIESAQLYQSLREQAQTLSILHEVSRELSSILDRVQLLKKVAERLQRLIDYDVFSVLLWSEEKRLLEPLMAFQRDGVQLAAIAGVPLGSGLCGAAAALRQSIRVPNVRLDHSSARVLIVDDDDGIALLERRALERAGFAAVTASSPAAAFELLGAETFDLVFLDYQLAGEATGLDLYRRLQDQWPGLPAILVTGFSDEGKVIKALRGGVRDVVPKIGDYLEYLPQAAERVLRTVRAERRLAESEAMLREANETLERRVEERTAELQRTKEIAESANRAKDHFLAVLSHELRTPLTPVLTTVQLLERRTDLPADLREPLAMIRRNVELEARLIDDLLDLTRIARGKLDLHFEPVDVHELLAEVLSICAGDFAMKRITLTTDLAARRRFVDADPARLQQVFWNLVKNAVKFTPEGGRVHVRSREFASIEADTVQVQVIDSGVGIEPGVLPRIFEAFEQGGKDVTRLFGGLGLGLAITKALMDLHGGSITAESAGKGLGATFTIELTAAREQPAAGPPAAAGAQAAGRPELRILLVEDHADTREALSELLRLSGHLVEAAASVASALAACEGGHFDLVISDLGLPDGSGLDLMRQILDRCPGGVRGICLTGYGMEEDLRRSEEAGFLAHLTKPVSLQELEAVMSRVMRPTVSP